VRQKVSEEKTTRSIIVSSSKIGSYENDSGN